MCPTSTQTTRFHFSVDNLEIWKSNKPENQYIIHVNKQTLNILKHLAGYVLDHLLDNKF